MEERLICRPSIMLDNCTLQEAAGGMLPLSFTSSKDQWQERLPGNSSIVEYFSADRAEQAVTYKSCRAPPE